jgi:hypothetical protein
MRKRSAGKPIIRPSCSSTYIMRFSDQARIATGSVARDGSILVIVIKCFLQYSISKTRRSILRKPYLGTPDCVNNAPIEDIHKIYSQFGLLGSWNLFQPYFDNHRRINQADGRISISLSPDSIRRINIGNIGRNDLSSAAFVVFPIRNHTIMGDFALLSDRSAKSSSFGIYSAHTEKVMGKLC